MANSIRNSPILQPSNSAWTADAALESAQAAPASSASSVSSASSAPRISRVAKGKWKADEAGPSGRAKNDSQINLDLLSLEHEPKEFGGRRGESSKHGASFPRKIPSSAHVTLSRASSSTRMRKQDLELTPDQIEQIAEHIQQMARRSPELHSRRFLFKKPSSEQYQYAKKRMDKDGRTLLASALRARVQGTDKPEWEIKWLPPDDALTMWLSVQHARLGCHTRSQRHDYRAAQMANVVHFGVSALLVPVFGAGIFLAKRAVKDFKQERKTYYNSGYRPEFREAFEAFMETLSSPDITDQHKLRIARALVDEHMRREKNISPEQTAKIETAIEAAIAEQAGSPTPDADNNTQLSAARDVDAPYRAVIAYATSSEWKKDLSEAQCQELLQGAKSVMATAQHRMKTKAPSGQLDIENLPTPSIAPSPAAARNRIKIYNKFVEDRLNSLDIAISAISREPASTVSAVPENLGVGRVWNRRNPVRYGLFGKIARFTEQGYASINKDLRKSNYSYDGDKLRDKLKGYLPEGRYIGISFRGSFALDRSKTQTPYCAEGGTFADRAFFSTTTSAAIGMVYTRHPPEKSLASEFRAGDYNTMFHVIGQSGVYIGGSEREVLYLPNTQFDVIFNGFDYRNKFYRPVLVEKHPRVPRGSGGGNYNVDILPPKEVGKSIDVANALSNNAFKTPVDELKFHVATALQHLPYERLTEILYEFIVWPALRIAQGESESSKKTYLEKFKADFPKYIPWTADNLPDLWSRLQSVIPDDIYRRFDESLRLDATKLEPLIDRTVTQISEGDDNIDRSRLQASLREKFESELQNRNYRIIDSTDAHEFAAEIYHFLEKRIGKDALRRMHWNTKNWKRPVEKFAVSHYPRWLEEIVREHNEQIQTTENGDMVDLEDLLRKVIRLISSFSTSNQVMEVLEPYLQKVKEQRKGMIDELNGFLRQELKFPHQSFKRRYESNAINYPFRR